MMGVHALGHLGDSAAAARVASSYYDRAAVADYYEQNEVRSEWLGHGAERLEFRGRVARDDVQAALAGEAAGLRVQNAGAPARQMGWDLVCAAPKSVSVAWALGDAGTRQAIEDAHVAAVREAVRYAEGELTTRRGHDGRAREPVAMMAAHYVHHTSRAQDPQLHSHVVIANLGVRRDGTVGTIESRQLYELQHTVGALYQAEAAHRLRGLGYAIEAGSTLGTFRLAEVDRQLERIFSKRREQITALAQSAGVASQGAVAALQRASRPAKELIPQERLDAHWRDEALAAASRGVGTATAPAHRHHGLLADRSAAALLERTLAAADHITEERAVFSRDVLVKEAARRAAATGEIGAAQVLSGVRLAERRLLHLEDGHRAGRALFTTPAMTAIEHDLIRRAGEMARVAGHGATPPAQRMAGLTEDQRGAVEAATQRSQIAVVSGIAGSGKTTAVATIREAYEAQGYTVEGIATAGRAARILDEEAGIQSRTVAAWLGAAEREGGPGQRVVMLDEGSMVSTPQIAAIVREVQERGDKLVIVHDDRQLAAIGPGAASRLVEGAVARVRPEATCAMTETLRQRDPELREVVRAAAQGRVADALQGLADQGRLRVYEERSTQREALVRDVVERETGSDPREWIVLTHERREARELNEVIRDALREHGLIMRDEVAVEHGRRETRLAAGDRVMATRNEYRDYDLRNGDRGTVVGVDVERHRVTVRFDQGRDLDLDVRRYGHLEHGWAVTTHKAQGSTADRVYVSAAFDAPQASRQATYVQLSRARDDVRVYVSGADLGEHGHDRERAHYEPDLGRVRAGPRGETITELAEHWGRDRGHANVSDYRPAHTRDRKQTQGPHRHEGGRER